MTRYVALLRGIGPSNPNMRNESLRQVVEELGYGNVRTVIASGNVLFESNTSDATDIEETLENAWPQRLGFHSTTIVRSRDQLSRLVEAEPFGDLEHGPATYLLATFTKEPPDLDWDLPYQPAGKPYRLEAMVDGTILSVTDVAGAPTSDLMGWLDQHFGKRISSRSWKTVERILARMS